MLVQAAACNLALLLRKMMGAGTPRALHDVVAGLFLALLRLISTARPDSERSRRIWTAIPHGRRNFARCVLPKAVGRKCPVQTRAASAPVLMAPGQPVVRTYGYGI